MYNEYKTIEIGEDVPYSYKQKRNNLNTPTSSVVVLVLARLSIERTVMIENEKK